MVPPEGGTTHVLHIFHHLGDTFTLGGLSEIIAPGRHGMLVRSRSATDLAEAVIKVTEDLALRNEIIQNARCKARFVPNGKSEHQRWRQA